MKTNFNLRRVLAVSLIVAACLLTVLSLLPAGTPSRKGLTLSLLKLDLGRAQPAERSSSTRQRFNPGPSSSGLRADAPTFGHPIISGIGGTGFEESLRIDPTNPNRIYTSVPGSAGADTSWIWHSLDGGKTFKWVVAAAPQEGKVTTCHGGGDTEMAIDSAGHLYFNDLTLANFSTSRSDDFGASFTCSNTGVPDTVVDRQWYAVDGDPTNGGTLYLANDEVGPGGVNCPGTLPGNNVLVMYRSPASGALAPTAGIEFGPAYHITTVGTCDEGIMGNDEISPVATTTGQPNGVGGFTPLASPVKHIYVVHDNAALNQVRLGRCFPVAFGLPVANVSDPSGLNCTDLLVADLGANSKTGGSFPTMAIDAAGNLYAVWEQAPIDVSGNVTGDTVLKYAYSTNEGNTWSSPMTIDTSGSPQGVLHNNVFAWISAGDDGRVNIAWYGTSAVSNPNDSTCGQNASVPPTPPAKNINGPDSVNGLWSLWLTQSLNAHNATPVFTPPILASEHHVHSGSIQTLIGGQCGNRTQGDFLQLRAGPQGEAEISYDDSNNIVSSVLGHGMFAHQNGGTGLFAANSPVSVPGITLFNGVLDPAGDGKFEAAGVSNANMPQLDILTSSVSEVTDTPCSTAAPCYKVTMQLNNLSLAPTLAQDPDTDLVWSTQWFVPSTSDSNGGKNFHVYAESNNGAALQCFVGENAVELIGGGGGLTYPGNTQLPAANCQSTLGANGTITIYVPLSSVSEPGAIDNRLHEVTASTMTLSQPANSVPSTGGIGGIFFDLIDVAQGYTFDPILLGAVSRKTHGGAGSFDIDLMPPASGIECRSGGATGDFEVVVSFATPITLTGATVTPGTGGTASTSGAPVISGSQVTVNLTNVSNAQRLTINLLDVNDGATTRDLSVPMAVLLGDVDGSGTVDGNDVSAVQSSTRVSVSSTTFRFDINASGLIDGNDVSLTQGQTRTFLR